MSGFYIGYLPKAPDDLRQFVRRVLILLFVVGAVVAVVLVIGQKQFATSIFEWQKERPFEGIIREHPYPVLLVERPGKTSAGEELSRYVLVGVGKHGAANDVRGFDGKRVRMNGKLIYRQGITLVEVMPNSITPLTAASSAPAETGGGEVVSLQGEIVDSKCYSGVMNPGEGKVHRDCAVRCISGGIPPALLTRSPDGSRKLYFLTAEDGGRVEPTSILDVVGEPVTITGKLVQSGRTELLRIGKISR